MGKIIFLFFVMLQSMNVLAQNTKNLELVINPGEYWWAVASIDMWGDNRGNQAQPLLLSSNGRYVWREEPIKYDFKKGKLTITVRDGNIVTGTAGNNLRTAFEYVSKPFFPSNGLIPDPNVVYTSAIQHMD